MRPLHLVPAILALVVTSAAFAQPDSAAPQSVTITLASYRYSPSPIVLKAGQPVRLLFQNQAGKGHDFDAPEFFAASRIMSGKIDRGKVNLDAGQSAAVSTLR